MNSLKRAWYRKILFFLYISGGWIIQTYAQTSPVTYSFINYAVNQGLPSSEVHKLYQDPKTGIMWIATDRGLVKYDGYNFTTYTMEDGLTENVILNLTPDEWGNLWCYTLNTKLCYVDCNGYIHPYKYNKEIEAAYDQKVHSGRFLTNCLYHDKNKSLYISAKHGLGQIIIDSSGKASCDFIGSVPNHKKFINFLPDRAYYYYSSSPKSKYAYPIDHTEINPGMMHEINDTTFLLSDNHKIKIYKGLILKKKLITVHPVLHSGKLNDSLFWVSYKIGGVDFFNISGEFKYHLLDHDIITDVLQDHEGGIWLSSVSNGIFYLKNIRIRTLNFNPNSRLISISSIRQKLFIGYYNGDVFVINAANFECSPYHEFKTQSPAFIHGDTVKNCLYLASRELTAWSGPGLKGVTRLTKYRTTKVSDHNDDTTLFFTTYNGFYVKSRDTLISLHTEIRILDVTMLGKDTLLATFDGLVKYTHGKLVKIEKAELDFRIEDVDKFRNGILCSSLGGGLIFYSADTTFAIKKADGLLSNLTTEVFVQNDSTIWLATIAGANKIIFDQKLHYTLYRYTIADGLLSNEVIDFDVTDQYIWIATKKGLNFIDKNDRPTYQSPKLFISIPKVIANGRQIAISGNKFQLGYNNNNVEVFFSAISFSQNQSLVYSYQLLPDNKEWNITSNRSIVFPALSPGKYQLKVRASTDRVNWSEEVILEMTITSPYWKRWWFIVLVIASIAFILVLIFIYRFKQQKLKMDALEMEMKALRAQMNPHFIFNSMASIQNFILKGNIDDSNKYLTKFSKLIRGVLENSKTELITIKKELDILNLYIELEQLRVKPFEYKLILDPSIPIETLQIPPMILQPFIENAIWHGLEPADKNGMLYIELKSLENKILCIIDDNGVGRNYFKKIDAPETIKIKEKSFGIEITRERINALKKTYHLDIELNIIDKVDENNLPTGTRVEILLPIINLK